MCGGDQACWGAVSVARMETRGYRILVRKPLGKGPLWWPKRNIDIDSKMSLWKQVMCFRRWANWHRLLHWLALVIGVKALDCATVLMYSCHNEACRIVEMCYKVQRAQVQIEGEWTCRFSLTLYHYTTSWCANAFYPSYEETEHEEDRWLVRVTSWKEIPEGCGTEWQKSGRTLGLLETERLDVTAIPWK